MADYTDDFAGGIGASWENGPGTWADFTASGGIVTCPSDADLGMRYTSAFANDQYSQAEFTAGGAAQGVYPGVAVRMTAADEECYAAYYHVLEDVVKILEVTEGLGNIELSSVSQTVGATGTIRIEIEGTNITAKLGGATITTASDATLASGQAGIVAYEGGGNTLTLDNWAGGDIGGAGRTTKNTRAFPLGVEVGMNFMGNI